MATPKVVVYHEPTGQHVVLDHESQISDYVNSLLGRPPDASIEVIPKEFQIFSGIPHIEMGRV